MRSQHFNILFGTLLVYSANCRNYYSGKVLHACFFLVTFRMKSETEFDETCFMQFFWEHDNVLDKRSIQHIKH